MEDDVILMEEHEEDLLSYIGKLEEQNRQLRDSLTRSDTQLAQLLLLHDTLLSRIEGVRMALEKRDKDNPLPEQPIPHSSIKPPEERSRSIAKSIMEDEEFKREIREAIQFAKVWKEKKTIGP